MIKDFKDKIKNKFKYYLLKEEEEEEQKEYEYNQKPSPYDNTNFFSKYLTFSWVTNLLWKGYFNEPLEMTDVFNIPQELKSKVTSRYLDNLNLKNLNRNSKGVSKYPLLFYLYKYVIFKNYTVIITQILTTILALVKPICLKYFINYISKPNNEKSYFIGFLLCCLLFSTSFIFSIIQGLFYWFGMKNSLIVQSALSTAIFEKTLKLSNSSKKRFNSGAITNLMSVDIESIKYFYWSHCIEIVSHPLQIVVLLILLVYIVGWSGLIGFLVMLLVIPINTYVCNKGSNYLDQSLKYTDKRSNLTNELINGIRFIKLYAWEKYFTKKIEKYREEELKLMFKRILFWIGDNVLVNITSGLVLVATFTTYSLSGHTMTPEVAFTAMNIFSNLRHPIFLLPINIYTLLSLLPSIKRVQRFLKCSEIKKYTVPNYNNEVNINNSSFKWDDDNSDVDDYYSDSEEEEEDNQEIVKKEKYNLGEDFVDSSDDDDDGLDSSKVQLIPKEQISNKPLIDIVIEKEKEKIESKNILNNINFNPPKGKLTIICSPVGTGKTSFISSLIGEIYKVEGQVSVPNNLSYSSQVPFLLNTSLRENILFGKPMDMDRYKKVIESCCLVPDLLQMAALDLTEIGERGINLSGGQKQRISLARALYLNSDCYIFDEPLSAVDPQVGTHLFNNCIQGDLLKDKTRILVTHQIQFIPSADLIVLIEDGKLIQGTYSELKERGVDFESIMKTKKLDHDEIIDENNILNNQNSESNDPNIVDKVISDKHDPDLLERAKLLVQEDRNEGSVSFNVYKQYFKTGAGTIFVISTFLMFFSSQAIFQISDFWLTIWTEQSVKDKSQGFYIVIYSSITLVFVLLVTLRYFMMARITFGCAKNLHHQLLSSVSNASCQFFDTNPSGRILNRFTRDIADIDVPMLDMICDALQCYSSFLVGILSIIYITPIMILPFCFLSLFYYMVQKLYGVSARELNRMESISLSPIYSLLQQVYNGLVTVRVFNQQSRFTEMMYQNIDIYSRCLFANMAVHSWVSVRLEVFANSLIFFSSFLSLFNSNTGFSILAIATSMSMTGYLDWAVKQSVEVELKMNSFERINTYIKTPPEGKRILKSDSKLKDWPSKGVVEFNGVEIKYRQNSEPSLKDITFKINSFEKVGVVGRTGAGKSTVGLSLFRMIECSKGSILIDGVDISNVGLTKLRSSLGVVPQDPYTFTGTIRSNIDPFNQYSDDDIWIALEKVKLNKSIYEMPKRLNTKIRENGEGLSFGQRQLLSLTRVILKGSKVILMDEATSGIDYQTAELIKNVLAKDENFINSTQLIIAHRLDTIIDSNKIAVIDKGNLVEYDTPSNLIKTEGSKFRSIVKYQTDFYEENKKKF